MVVRVRLSNENETWGDNPFIEIEMPAAPQQDMQIFLGDALIEELINKATPFFTRWKMGMPCVWDASYVYEMMYDVEDAVWNVALDTSSKF